MDSWLADPCYVAYEGDPPSNQQLAEVEKLENQIITSGVPVHAREVSAEELRRDFPDSPNISRLPSIQRLRIVTMKAVGLSPVAVLISGMFPK